MKRFLLVISIIVSAALHIWIYAEALTERSALTADSVQYLTLAENLTAGNGYSQSYTPPYAPDLQRPPGYPLLLAALGREVWLILLIQHLMIFGTAYLLFKILRRKFSPATAYFCAWLFTVQPYFLLFGSLILSETLFLFFFIAAGYFLLKFREEDSWLLLISGMTLLVLSVYVRPVTLPLIPLSAVAAAFWSWRRHRSAALAVAGVILPALLLSPWMWRNHDVSGRWIFSSMSDMAMLHARTGGMETMRSGGELHEHSFFMNGDSILAAQKGLPALKANSPWKQTHETELYNRGVTAVSLNYFFSHPLDAVRFEITCASLMLKGIAYGWAKQITGNDLCAGILAAWQFLLNLVLYGSALLSLFVLRQNRWLWLPLALTLFIFLVSAVAWADGRYRMPADLIAYVFVAFWFSKWMRRFGAG